MRTILSEQEFLARFPNSWLTIDSHTVGESTRVLIGYPPIPGNTINEKRLHLQNHDDVLRELLTREPRGSRETVGVVITEPVTPGAACGMIYMDARRYPYLCGHGTIGAITTLIETGLLDVQAGQPELTVDTPSGPVSVTAHMEGKKVKSVSIQMVPSFVYKSGQVLELPGRGSIRVDLVYSGGFFAMVDKDQVGIELLAENAPLLIPLGMEIIAAANQQLTVQHPIQRNVTTIDVAEFYDTSGHAQRRGKNAVIYGESHLDRSPCGTGTCAKLALLYQHGELATGELFTNAGILDTTFETRILEITQVGPYPATVGEIRGSAFITGYHRFVLDPADPFPGGFLI